MKYRKNSIVVEAFQMTRERRLDNSDWPEWLNKAWNYERGEPGSLQISQSSTPGITAPEDSELEIVTLEGAHHILWGDWIIKGIKGELYPCKPDIFEKTYSPYKADWYEENIEEPIRDIVRLLRDNGINTTCSCGHTMEIQGDTTLNVETLKIIDELLCRYLHKNKEKLQFEVTIVYRMVNGHGLSHFNLRLTGRLEK